MGGIVMDVVRRKGGGGIRKQTKEQGKDGMEGD